MKKTLLIIVITFLSHAYLLAQDTASYLQPKQIKLNATLIGASVSYEARVSHTNTLYFEGGLQYGLSYTYSSVYGNDYRYELSPAFSVAARHYYHFKERLDKHKDISNNASNFWFLQTGYSFKPLSHTAGYIFSDAVSAMPGWGIQRSLGEHFSLELQLGALFSYFPSNSTWYVGPGGGLKIGYIFK